MKTLGKAFRETLMVGSVFMAVFIGFIKPFESNHTTAYVFMGLAAFVIFLLYYEVINIYKLIVWIIAIWFVIPVAIIVVIFGSVLRVIKTAIKDITE
jgi:hypothetical protein